jgi:hypothetical protein
MLHEAVEEIPRAYADSNMIVVDEAHELFQNLWNIPGLILKKRAISDTYFHILELDRRVSKRGNPFSIISQSSIVDNIFLSYQIRPSWTS